MSEGTESKALRIEGRVQGVGFRMWTVRTGQAVGVRGWVRNLHDGAVEAHVEGEAEAVARMRTLLQEGPATARVDRIVELGEGEGVPEAGFEVRG